MRSLAAILLPVFLIYSGASRAAGADLEVILAAPAPGPVPLHLATIETLWVPVRSYVLFHSRAPPRA